MTGKYVVRRRTLTNRPLQLRLIASFVGMSMLALIIQFMVLSTRMLDLAGRGAPEGFAEEMSSFLLSVFGLSFGVLLPLTVVVGIVTTFRIAGPLYRFEHYLRQVVRGEADGPCHIRKNDQLHELCDLINEGLEAARRQGLADAKRDLPALQEAA